MFPQSPLAATLDVLTRSVGPGDELRYRITNVGSVALLCGLRYRLERETSDGWVHMNPGMAFRTIGFGVSPDEIRDLAAAIPAQGPAGLYRLITSVSSDPSAASAEPGEPPEHASETLQLSVRFDVLGESA